MIDNRMQTHRVYILNFNEKLSCVDIIDMIDADNIIHKMEHTYTLSYKRPIINQHNLTYQYMYHVTCTRYM